jgi:hypothetical protein
MVAKIIANIFYKASNKKANNFREVIYGKSLQIANQCNHAQYQDIE